MNVIPMRSTSVGIIQDVNEVIQNSFEPFAKQVLCVCMRGCIVLRFVVLHCIRARVRVVRVCMSVEVAHR